MSNEALPAEKQLPGPKQPPRIHGDGCRCGDSPRHDCPARAAWEASHKHSHEPEVRLVNSGYVVTEKNRTTCIHGVRLVPRGNEEYRACEQCFTFLYRDKIFKEKEPQPCIHPWTHIVFSEDGNPACSSCKTNLLGPTLPPEVVMTAEDVVIEFKRRAAISPLGDCFISGPLKGTSVHNVLMYAARKVEGMLEARITIPTKETSR